MELKRREMVCGIDQERGRSGFNGSVKLGSIEGEESNDQSRREIEELSDRMRQGGRRVIRREIRVGSGIR